MIAATELPAQAGTGTGSSWMTLLFKKADEVATQVKSRRQAALETASAQSGGKPGAKLALPAPETEPPSNAATVYKDSPPPRFPPDQWPRETAFYWKYVWKPSPAQQSDASSKSEIARGCEKRPGQKFWVVSYAAGPQRQRFRDKFTLPSCKKWGADEVIAFGPEDLDPEFRERNKQTLADGHGVGMWIWKHWAEYQTLGRMNEGDIAFYVDSDFQCNENTMQFFCLAQYHDVVPFHHGHPWYKLYSMASRDSMILMGQDERKYAGSVQYSGGNVIFRKTAFTVAFFREMSAYSQQHGVMCCFGRGSAIGEDYPEFAQGRGGMHFMHQCDQAVSSLLVMKYGLKSFPWNRLGYGGGSDDALNAAERAEAGLTLRPVTTDIPKL